MHEISAIQALCHQVEEIARKHKAEKVIRVFLEIGEFCHLTPEHLEETFLMFRAFHPLLKETELNLRRSPEIQDEAILLRDVELEVLDAG